MTRVRYGDETHKALRLQYAVSDVHQRAKIAKGWGAHDLEGVIAAVKESAGERCPDCGVPRGELHQPGCDVEECRFCGLQKTGCDCPDEIPEGYKLVHHAGGKVELLPLTDDDRRRADAYAAFMAEAEAQWSDATQALSEATGLVWSVWQTGGMCLLLGATADDGRYAMLGDTFGPIQQNRSTGYDGLSADDGPLHWQLGLYPADGDEAEHMQTIELAPDRPADDAELARRVADVLAEWWT